jgi:hypothetical protein
MYNYHDSAIRTDRLNQGTDHCGSHGTVFALADLVNESGEVVDPRSRERLLDTKVGVVVIFAVDEEFAFQKAQGKTMTKAEILDLIAADVDDVSRAAVRLSSKQIPGTLRAAAELLTLIDAGIAFESRVQAVKLLRFVQAALAGASVPIPAAAAEKIGASVRRIRDASMPDVHRAAEDVLRVLQQAPIYRMPSPKKTSKLKVPKKANSGILKVLKAKGRQQPRRKAAG